MTKVKLTGLLLTFALIGATAQKYGSEYVEARSRTPEGCVKKVWEEVAKLPEFASLSPEQVAEAKENSDYFIGHFCAKAKYDYRVVMIMLDQLRYSH